MRLFVLQNNVVYQNLLLLITSYFRAAFPSHFRKVPSRKLGASSVYSELDKLHLSDLCLKSCAY